MQVAKVLRGAEEYCRSLFFEDPSMSIDEAARAVADEYRGDKGPSLTKNAVSRIRHEVRQAIGLKSVEVQLPRGDVPPPFNPPRLVVSKEEGEGEEMVAAMKEGPKRRQSTTEERRSWFSDWAMAHPDASTSEAREALYREFTVALGTTYISETLRTARSLFEEDQRRKGAVPAFGPEESNPPPPSEIASHELHTITPQDLGSASPERERALTLKLALQILRDNGVREVRVKEDGTYTVDM